ncbi:efflux RND transporter permease subunit [Myxococcota bacterium]|nr:efflux RND transporter permease subunit [Myxococcota bacterium]MBU1431906.1 efflux RND transporter permease subunit [Myxococcota bacterium]MBU1897061.1 efflux RND transporter permease subunit [Myxococcota bacterium]
MIITKAALQFRPSVYVLLALILITGTDAYLTLPLEAAPDVQIPIILVSTVYPGVAPEDIETLLTTPLERELKDLKDVKEMTSSNSESVSMIQIEFNSGVDMDQAYQKTRDKVDKARPDLPKDAEDPTLMEINISEFPIMVVNVYGSGNILDIKANAERLQDEIEMVPGVLDVKLTGGEEREIHIHLDPQKMENHEVSLGLVISRIQQEHINIPGGNLTLGGSKYLVRLSGEYKNVKEMEQIVLKTPEGRSVKIKDIGYVEDGFKERKSISRVNGQECVTLRVQKRSGENIVRIAEDVKGLLEAFKKTLPEGMSVFIQQDESKHIRSIVTDLENSVISGLILVLGVLLFWMGARNAFFVAIAIPLSLMMTFATLSMMGITLNMVVLFSLIIALGMLVDNSIVVVESIFRHASEGKSRMEAAYEGTKEVAWPIIASTATTVAAFGPMLFWPDIMGEFMSYLPKTVIISLLASLFVALVINPVIAATFLKPGAALFDDSGEAKGLILGSYNRALRLSLKWPATIFGLSMLLFALVLFLFIELNAGVEFFAETTPERAQVSVKTALGTELGRTDEMTGWVEALAGQDDNIETMVANVGFGGGSMTGSSASTHLAVVDVEFKDRHERGARTPQMSIKDLRAAVAELPGGEFRIQTQKMGPPTGAPVDVRISGKDYTILREYAQRIADLLGTIEGVVDVKNDYEAGLPEVRVLVDREAAKLRGVSTAAIGDAIRGAINGVEAAKLREGDKEYEIVVRFAPEFRRNLDDLRNLRVTGKDDIQIPLRDVTRVVTAGGVGTINHTDRKRTISITADVAGQRSSSEVLVEVQALVDQKIKPPSGYQLRYGGESEEQDKAASFLGRAFLIGVFIMALILITQFNSLLTPMIILGSIIMSLMGVFLGLLVLRDKFGIMMTGMGVISLAGVVVNNAIVLIDYINQLRARGEALVEAIAIAGLVRFRPVMMTAVTTVLGMLPMALGVNIDFRNLAFDSGGGSTEWWGPMARAIVFGLAIATVMTLIMVPVMYLLKERIVALALRLLGREAVAK